MVIKKQLTRKQLEKQISIERGKISGQQKRIKQKAELKNLQKELSLLKSPGKQKAIRLGKRFGRGFKILGKKTGSAIAKQARLIKEQQIRENKAAKKAGKRIRKGSKKIQQGGFSFLEPLDF